MNRTIAVALRALLVFSTAATLAVAADSEETFRDRLRFIPDTETGRTPGEINTSKPIKILNARNIETDTIPAERVYLGQMYKACVIRLPDDTLRLSVRATAPRYNFTKNEFPILKSTDGGRAWSKLPEPPFNPCENYMSALSDGTVLMTFAGSWRDKSQGDFSSTIYRSKDGCRDWQPCGPSGSVVGSRNVLQLADGSLLWGQAKLSSSAKQKDRLWRSTDDGRTWTEKYPARFEGMPDDYPYGMFL
ncbi:MAG: sialidase family protein, partial [Planctomycetota bacterium]|nr:sialidase family protein [Planctomycetota bacterium]